MKANFYRNVIACLATVFLFVSQASAVPQTFRFEDDGIFAFRFIREGQPSGNALFEARFSTMGLIATVNPEREGVRIAVNEGEFIRGDVFRVDNGNTNQVGTVRGDLELFFRDVALSERGALLAAGTSGSTSSGRLGLAIDFNDIEDVQQTLNVFSPFHAIDGVSDTANLAIFAGPDGGLAGGSVTHSLLTAPGQFLSIRGGNFVLRGDLGLNGDVSFLGPNGVRGETEVPEPATMLLLGAGMLGAGFRRSRRNPIDCQV